MWYLKNFEAHSDYEAYIDGDDPLLPNVSVCDDDELVVVHFNPYVEYIFVTVKYMLGGTVETNKIGNGYLYSAIDNIYLDGEEFPKENLIYVSDGEGYVAFPDGVNGEHTVEFDLGDGLFRENWLKSLDGVATYEILSVPDRNNPLNFTNGVEYVDLGLPSGKLWAKCNLGATSETEYGDYYMWASTTPNTNDTCDWAHTPYHKGSYYSSGWLKYNTVSSYGTVDNLTELEHSDDAARVQLGGQWMMPSRAELNELYKLTNTEWTTMGGVNGYKFTNKTDSSKYLFIPASGSRYGSSISDVGSSLLIWSRSLMGSIPNDAWMLYGNSYSLKMGDNYRCSGYSVRGLL